MAYDARIKIDETNVAYKGHGELIAEHIRVGLIIPKDSAVYLTCYCYIAFALQQDIQPTCQKNYIDYCIAINQFAELLSSNNK